MEVEEYILDTLQREYSFKEGVDLDALDYVAEGYMDSLGLVQFIVELESEFNISFSDEELSSSDFKIVGKLIKMVERKMENE